MQTGGLSTIYGWEYCIWFKNFNWKLFPSCIFRQIAASKILVLYILGYWNQPQIHQVWWCRYRRVDPFQAHVRGSLLRIPPSRTFRRQVNIFFLHRAMSSPYYFQFIRKVVFFYLKKSRMKLNWHPWNLVEIILRRICNCQKTYSIRSTARFFNHWLDESIPDLHKQ